MSPSLPRSRGRAHSLGVLAAVISLFGTTLLLGSAPASAAGERGGDVVVVDTSGAPLEGGGSATPFGLKLPDGAACQGDSADDSYRVEAFLVPEGTDLGSVVYGELTPDVENAWGLWDTNTESFDGGLTAQADPGQPGLISDLPNFSWGVMLPDEMKPGDYRIGIACSLFNETTRYWDASYTIIADSSDEPAQFRWSTTAASGTSSSSSTLPTAALLGGLVFLLLVVGLLYLWLRSRTPRPSPSKERQS